MAAHGGREVKSTGDGLMVAFERRGGCALRDRHAARDHRRSGRRLERRPRRRRAAARRRRSLRHAGHRGERLCDAAGAGRDPRLRPRRPDRRRTAWRSSCSRPERSCAVSPSGWRASRVALARRGGAHSAPRGPRRRARSSVVVADDQRPAARRLPRDPRRRARHQGGRGGGRRARGRRRGHAPPAGRRADGHPHARAGRSAGRRADPGRARARDRRADAHDVRPSRVRLRGAADRRERLPAEGHARRPAARRRPRRRRRARRCWRHRSRGG